MQFFNLRMKELKLTYQFIWRVIYFRFPICDENGEIMTEPRLAK